MNIEEIDIKPLFPELYIDYCSLSTFFILIYPLSLRNYYVFISKLQTIVNNYENIKDEITLFIYNKRDEIANLLADIYSDDTIKSYNEDDIIRLFMSTITINMSTITVDDSKKDDDTEQTVKTLKTYINNILTTMNDIIKVYVKYKKNDEFSINGNPELICKITGMPCMFSSCRYFDHQNMDCKYSHLNFNYLTLGGTLIYNSLVVNHDLESKDFLHRMLTGESFLDKIDTTRIRGKVIERENNLFIDDSEKERIYDTVKRIIYDDKKNIDFGIGNQFGMYNTYIEKVKNKTLEPEDVDLKGIIDLLPKYDSNICDIVKYILFIREQGIRNDFPNDMDYSLQRVNDNYNKTIQVYGNNIDDDTRLIHYKLWDKVRYDEFTKAFNNNDIVRMRIIYDDWLFNWYWFVLRKEYNINIDSITYEDILLKYVIDCLLLKLSFAMTYEKVIFNDNSKSGVFIRVYNKIHDCINKLNNKTKIMKNFTENKYSNAILFNTKFYIFDKEKYTEDVKQSDDKKEHRLVINKPDFIKNIDKFKEYLMELHTASHCQFKDK